jgi:acetyl esterase/lipase
MGAPQKGIEFIGPILAAMQWEIVRDRRHYEAPERYHAPPAPAKCNPLNGVDPSEKRTALPSFLRYHSFVHKLRLVSVAIFALASIASAQQTPIPLWPNGVPDSPPAAGLQKESSAPGDYKVAGQPISILSNVSVPSLTVVSPDSARNTGAAVVVFPGGGYNILAYDLEGTEVCDWLHSIGVTCVLVKYRVPIKDHFPKSTADLQDAQQAMRITRSHAAEWHINPNRIGVLGFSAGGHLAAVLSNHFDYKPAGAPDAAINARPDFALIIYPGYLAEGPALDKLAPEVQPSATTPPTFLLQAEDDPVHEECALVYFQALKQAKVPAELHIFAEGGHGYGLRPTKLPVTHWPVYAETWLHSIGMIDGPPPALATGAQH